MSTTGCGWLNIVFVLCCPVSASDYFAFVDAYMFYFWCVLLLLPAVLEARCRPADAIKQGPGNVADYTCYDLNFLGLTKRCDGTCQTGYNGHVEATCTEFGTVYSYSGSCVPGMRWKGGFAIELRHATLQFQSHGCASS